MIEMSFQEFKTFKNKEKFIFFFTLENYGCGGCVIQESEYKKHNIQNLIKVKAETEEDLMEAGIQALPYTCTFSEDGKKKIEKYGVLYETQIKKLLGE